MEVGKRCLWCNVDGDNTSLTFDKKAHTIPKSLGGRFLCEEVCDDCNYHFGSREYNKIAVEVVLKEAFELTRHMVFSGKGKTNHYARFKSIFFVLNVRNKTFSLKPVYSIKPGFQESIARQFKRGLYKIFLEEYHRQIDKGMDERFNFVREFARYDLGDYPVFYLVPKFPALFYSEDEFISPRLNFKEYFLERIESFEFYQLHIFGHAFLLPTLRNWHLNWDLIKIKSELEIQYKGMIPINRFSDVDFACSFMDSGKSALNL